MDNIIECIIDLHNGSVNLPYNIVNDDETFGLFTIKLKPNPIREGPFHFVFMIDTTLSMLEKDDFGITKIKYMKETLEKMLIYLESLKPKIYVTIYTFNITPTLLVNNIMLSKASVQFIEEFIKDIKAENCTNIQAALEKSHTILSKIDRECQCAHIFMTDGEANYGIRDANKLADLIDTTVPNVFIGFGKNHNSTMLSKFVERGNCEYYFVDNLENSMLVYAESVNNILYGVFYGVRYHILDGELYDFKTNQWTNILYESVLSSDSHKFYQLRTNSPDFVEVFVYNDYDEVNSQNSLIDTAVPLPDLHDIEGECLIITDLTKYAYRQKVQSLLFSAKNMSKNTDIFSQDFDIEFKCNDNSELLTEMKEVFGTIRKYMITKDLMEDPLLRLLCDDIYVTIKAIDNGLEASMYAEARHTSQGRQRSYNVGASIPDQVSCNTAFTMNYNDIQPLKRNDYIALSSGNETFNYTMDRITTTCFASPTMINTFRDVSVRINRSPSFLADEDD